MPLAHTWGYEPFHPRRKYRPLEDILDDGTPISGCINIGPLQEGVLETELPISVVSEVAEALPTGCYWFGNVNEVELMVVEQGAESTGAFELGIADAEGDEFLAVARQWFDHYATMASGVPVPLFGRNDEVVARGGDTVGTVRSRHFSDGWTYNVTIAGRESRISESSLQPAVATGGPVDWVKAKPDGPRSISATITRQKLSLAGMDTLFSFRATRTVFRPYQFKPVMKILDSRESRLLIADEVGLGKTIEAGLVWTELEARRLANRVLVVCPSSLVRKWQAEMEQRFDFGLQELTSDLLRDLDEKIEAGRLPARFAYVCSVERMRMWNQNRAEDADTFPLDLAIIDEAHVMRNHGTASNRLGHQIAQWSDALVMLSATPLNLHRGDLFELLKMLSQQDFSSEEELEMLLEPSGHLQKVSQSLLDERTTGRDRLGWMRDAAETTIGHGLSRRPAFGRLQELVAAPALTPEAIAESRRLINELHPLAGVVTRTRKAEVQEERPVRTPQPIDVELKPHEREFYDGYVEWLRERAREGGTPPGFAIQMPLRIASTCLPVARDRVLQAARGQFEGAQIDGDDGRAAERTSLAAVPPDSELRSLAERIPDSDSKFEAFVTNLRRFVDQGRRVLVFTFSRMTIRYLEGMLRGEFRVASLHGGVPADKRHEVMADFRAGAYDVLLANKVASEGLDFEFCSVVFNYDLPWNPMEVEQRIGRVDRIGQVEKKIHIVNFITPGTVESDIIYRLYERIRVFEQTIGELEPILVGKVQEIQDLASDFNLTEREKQIRAREQLAAVATNEQEREVLESAAVSLFATDTAEIEGLEDDIVGGGRYVGQRELVALVSDWARICGAPEPMESGDGKTLLVRGNRAMAETLDKVVSQHIRARIEVEDLRATLVAEQDYWLSIDPEWSRQAGPPLLTAQHPLVLAARQVSAIKQSRFAHVRLVARDDLPAGEFLFLATSAHWSGIRPTSELWLTGLDLDTLVDASDSVEREIRSSVAEGTLRHAALDGRSDLVMAVRDLLRREDAHALVVETERRAENEAIADIRRESLAEKHRKLIVSRELRVEDAERNSKTQILPALRGQVRHAKIRRDEALERLAEQGAANSLTRDHLAALRVTVV